MSVSIIGATGLTSNATNAEFFCTAPAAAGQFTIPSQVLALLPPAGIESNLEPGMDLLVGLVPNIAQNVLTAPNLDYGLLFSFTDNNATAIVSLK